VRPDSEREISKGKCVSGVDIFLSYARADRAAARMFAEAFVHEGFTVWWDASLHSGETFDEVIEKNLREAKAVVVLWSPRSVASRWVRAEATQADRRNKLAPAIIEPCDRPIIFELTHAADLCEWTGDITDLHWRAFMDDLRRLVDAGADREIPAVSRPAARPPGARAAPAEQIPNRAASRQPLRPGSNEVIQAGRTVREPLIQPAPASHEHPVEAEADPHSEVHCLELEDGELSPETVVVESSGVKIGRTAPADIVLSHKSVSREHCIIGLANDELVVTDLNSTNGTYVDDERVQRATIVPVGSVLRLGQISLKHAVRPRSDSDSLDNPAGGLQATRFAAVR
jgi:hypothetical protein